MAQLKLAISVALEAFPREPTAIVTSTHILLSTRNTSGTRRREPELIRGKSSAKNLGSRHDKDVERIGEESMETFYAIVITGLLMFCAANPVAAQETKSTGSIVTNDNNCESNKAYFDSVAVAAGSDGLIILIARLGNGEISGVYNRLRLHNISTYLNYIREIPNKRILRAEGERVRGRGRVEVYVSGKLMIVFTVGRNQDLAGGECESPSSSRYYPMRRKPL